MRRFSITVVVASLFLIITGVTRTFGADDEVLAKVGNEVITRIDFETRLRSFPPLEQQKIKDVEKRKQLLESIIKARLIVVEGMNRGLTENPELKAKLKMMRDDAIAQKYMDDYLEKKAEVSDEEAENYYNNHPGIRDREFLKVSQIVVKKEEEAREILEKLKKGEPFKKLVREKSIDPVSKQMGGELEWFEKGMEKKEIEEAVLNLEKGGVSEIVKAKGSYYIFKLDDKRIDPKPPFPKIKKEIIKQLKLKKINELFEKEIEELKKKIPVEAFYDKLTPEAK